MARGIPEFTAEAVNAEIISAVRQTVAASPGATVRAQLRAAARSLRLSIGRCADFWYGEVRFVPAHEADQIRYFSAEAQRLAREREIQYRNQRARFVAAAPGLVGKLAPPPPVPAKRKGLERPRRRSAAPF